LLLSTLKIEKSPIAAAINVNNKARFLIADISVSLQNGIAQRDAC
jgi:hypothetical protein